MKRLLFIVAALAASALFVLVSAAWAGQVTLSTSPDAVAVGESFTAEVCGLGGRTASIVVTAPDDSTQVWQMYAPTCGSISVLADQPGTYTVEVFNKNGGGGHPLASATEVAS